MADPTDTDRDVAYAVIRAVTGRLVGPNGDNTSALAGAEAERELETYPPRDVIAITTTALAETLFRVSESYGVPNAVLWRDVALWLRRWVDGVPGPGEPPTRAGDGDQATAPILGLIAAVTVMLHGDPSGDDDLSGELHAAAARLHSSGRAWATAAALVVVLMTVDECVRATGADRAELWQAVALRVAERDVEGDDSGR